MKCKTMSLRYVIPGSESKKQTGTSVICRCPCLKLVGSSTFSVYSFIFLFNITNSITSAAVAKIWAMPAKPEIIPFMPEESSVPSTSRTPLTTSMTAINGTAILYSTKNCLLYTSRQKSGLDDMVEYSSEAVNSIDWRSDSNIGIKAGEAITMEQSLYGLLVGSASECGNAIGEHISGNVDVYKRQV